MPERYTVKVALYLILTRETNGVHEILLQRRANTGYMDGKFDVSCSGHLEANESLAHGIIREASEELGIKIKESDLNQVFLAQKMDEEYLKIFFTVDMKHANGEPQIMEPDKCSELRWVELNNLPEDLIPYLATVLHKIEAGEQYSVVA